MNVRGQFSLSRSLGGVQYQKECNTTHLREQRFVAANGISQNWSLLWSCFVQLHFEISQKHSPKLTVCHSLPLKNDGWKTKPFLLGPCLFLGSNWLLPSGKITSNCFFSTNCLGDGDDGVGWSFPARSCSNSSILLGKRCTFLKG